LLAWGWLDEYTLPEVVQCVSVGFLVAETEAALALAPDLADLEQERTQGSDVSRIPRGAVRQIADL
jgi:hypothetical protein